MMRVAVFSTKSYDESFLTQANAKHGHEFTFFEPRLESSTVPLAAGADAICAFVNDRLDRPVLESLRALGVRFVALRCAGFNNVDLLAAKELGFRIARVPAYSPYAVAEYTVGLMLSLNRKIHRAVSRVREGNFSLDGLLGFDFHGKTVGIVGTGQIGQVVAKILQGFGCKLLGHDVRQNPECVQLGMQYVSLTDLFASSDVVTLHCPLLPSTYHLIDREAIAEMKSGVMLINTSRGGVVDARALLDGLKAGKVGSLGLDVYEEEANYFFEDKSDEWIADDVLARLLTFPNVVVTSHQAFFTREAMSAIAETSIDNLNRFAAGIESTNELYPANG